MDIKPFVEGGKLLGLEGDELRKYVEKEKTQLLEREERDKERDMRKYEMEMKVKEQEIELEKKKAETMSLTPTVSSSGVAKLPKLPNFEENKDDIDSFLQRFERFAEAAKWDKSSWATTLSAHLKGEALSVYSRLTTGDALNYDKVKVSLLKRFQMTEEGFRVKLRTSKPIVGETTSQFSVRLENYFDRWIELAKAPKTYDGARDLFIREQILEQVSRPLSLFLKERNPKTVAEMVDHADKYEEAHRQVSYNGPAILRKECYICKSAAHLSRDCPRHMRNKASSMVEHSWRGRGPFRGRGRGGPNRGTGGGQGAPYGGNGGKGDQKAGACLQQLNACCKEGDKLKLSCGHELPLVSAACNKHLKSPIDERMPVSDGYVGENIVSVLRDTGCSSVVVKAEFVKNDDYTGETKTCVLIDGTVRRVPIAKISIDTLYFNGELEAMVMQNPVYDLILGNIDGLNENACCEIPPESQVSCISQSPNSVTEECTEVNEDVEYNNNEEANAVQTRAQVEKEKKPRTPLKVADEIIGTEREKLIKAQADDDTLIKIRHEIEDGKKHPLPDGGQFLFEMDDKVIHRIYTKGDTCTRQVVVPVGYRNQVMSLGHDGIMAGHLATKKTLDRVMADFYWPGICADVKRYCQSCAVCQKTFPKGKVQQLPIGDMPLIDTPFERIAIDLVGPIHPPSERGHRFILTVVDYASRYPEAVPLKNIDSIEVAEALLDIYSRIGLPSEVLTDRGKQFTSDLMKEVCRLLSIRQMNTTPYHPQCNGLCERFNGTLKRMLRRMTESQPKQWDRYIPALLFAYRDSVQESLGFTPFELIYGRTVRGPLTVLKELWTSNDKEDETKTTFQYVMDLREKMEDTMKIAQDNLASASKRYRVYANKGKKMRRFSVGDSVLLLLPTDNNKLLMQWKGPYKVVKVSNDRDYVIDINGLHKKFHANMLKKFIERQEDTEQVQGCISITEEIEVSMDCEKVAKVELPHLDAIETTEDVDINPELHPEQIKALKDLIRKYPDVITDVPGKTGIMKHEIKLTSETPMRSKAYPVPHAVKTELKEEIEKMLKADIITHSESPYASPVVIVKKPDNTNRFCCDYRKLNKVTIFDAEPISNAENIFNKLGSSKYFSKMDMAKGYWQIEMEESSKKYTAFVTEFGLFEFRRMPFGLVNAGATFNKMMRKILYGLEAVENFVDDIIEHTQGFDEHIIELKKLLERLRQSKVTVKPSKCKLGYTKVEFLGHKVSEGKIEPSPGKVVSIGKCERPKTKKQVRSFLGMIGYYGKFIQNYSAVAAPLSDLTKKGMPNEVVWNGNLERSFQSLARSISSSPVLRLPNFDLDFVVRTDASEVGIGSVLLQEHDGMLFPVAYASRKLRAAECNYSTIEKECLALIWGIQKFTLYLYGRYFILESDHQPLAYINKAKVANARVMRWALALQEFQFTVRYIKGSENVGADFLSRHPSD